MHPAWALGYEQSTRAWMNFGELDFVTTYFREKKIPVDGFDLLTTYDGGGGIGRDAAGLKPTCSPHPFVSSRDRACRETWGQC